MDQAVGKYKTKFVKRTPRTEDVQTNFFEKPDGFSWYAGQYLRWSLELENPDERGSSRYFTNSSSPTEEFISITTKRGMSAFKNKLFSLNEGDEVGFFGPLGTLFINEEDPGTKIMLAGGIGITPFRSILKYANDSKAPNKLILLVSFSFKKEAIFYEELKEIEKNNENIKVIYTLTKEKMDGFEEGRISEEMIRKYVENVSDSTFFVVGPPAMQDALINIVEGMGIAEEKIVKESFTGY